jgi:putative flavoprotein involved in K+ transport
MRPRATGVSGRTVTFEDGSTLDVDAVVWATGFRLDHSFLQPAVASANGTVSHRRGVTEIPGLYFLGLTWQHTRGSALLGWVKEDAAFIVERIAERTAAPRAAEAA